MKELTAETIKGKKQVSVKPIIEPENIQSSTVDKYYAKDRQALRDWFEENHVTSNGVWLIYDKNVSGTRKLKYDDIVEEAICFGWIDSVTRSLNDRQAMQYLSPRRPKSPWSKLNKDRVEKLIKEKLMTEAGLDVIERSKKDGSWTIYDSIEKLEVPEDLKNELSNNRIAQKNFGNFSSSNKKQILWYIASAKKSETRMKRIKQIVSEAEKNSNPLEYRKNKK
ncbi:MAG TPA: YdeI/OmpD-associated family protein [Methanosarcina sp.]|nr:YdeI/OmpD-associated family protein [Methanosarcina sp.]